MYEFYCSLCAPYLQRVPRLAADVVLQTWPTEIPISAERSEVPSALGTEQSAGTCGILSEIQLIE